MTVLHTGSTKQFAEGWEAIFSGRKTTKTSSAKRTAAATRPAPRPAAHKRKASSVKRAKSRSR